MKKTLIATAFALAFAGGSLALQSPASAHPGGPSPALAASTQNGWISTVASHASAPAQNRLAPQPQQEPQEYPKYHDQQTDAYYAQPMKANPCHFTQANVDGGMRQVEVCD
jgi:hypothetical protein